MKHTVQFTSVVGEEITQEEFKEIIDKFEFIKCGPYLLKGELPAESEELESFERFVVDELGITIRRRGSNPPPESESSFIRFDGSRIIEPSDLVGDYFSLQSNMGRAFRTMTFSEDGSYEFYLKDCYKAIDAGMGPSHKEVICSTSMKEEMLAQGFENIAFKEIKCIDNPAESRWALSSERTLPYSLNDFIVYTNEVEGKTYTGHQFNEFYITQLHKYAAKQLEDFGSFDVAMTAEVIVGGATSVQRGRQVPIVSKKFMKWAVNRGLKMWWDPIVIEE